MTDSIDYLQFASGAADADLHLLSVAGHEQISQLYEFRLVLQHDPGVLTPEEIDKLLLSPCAFTLGATSAEVVHGIIKDLRLLKSSRDDPALYEALVVPTVWLLTLSKISRSFQKQSAVEMVKSILSAYQLQEGKQFEILIDDANASGPKNQREFVLQYDESDWDFIQRWLEQEGFSYWFEHREKSEVLIIGDGVGKPIADPSNLPYTDWDAPGDDQGSVRSLTESYRRIPARVVLKDYDYRHPAVVLVAPAPVDEKRGFGTQFEYGEHFRDIDAGKALARRRADQIINTRCVYQGVTSCRRFRVGHTFTLEDHFESRFNQKYLITAISHSVGIFDSAAEPEPYTGTFEAITTGAPYRPPRLTPWPSIHGVIHAHIDADDDGQHATLDEYGRYRVRFPFDGTDASGSHASHLIRMAQSYAGAGYGNHFPLHKGTEVVVAFLDGDPDRPLIVGAVPNAQTVSPSTSTNANQSVIQTASGIRIEMEDKA